MLGELEVRPMVTTVVLHGELDLVTVEALRSLLDEAVVEDPSRLVIDIADVPFVDVLSLSTILATADAVRDRGGVAMVRGATAAVRRVCHLLNADDVLAADVPLQRRFAG
jgi:anti-sigma B factor antagonist